MKKGIFSVCAPPPPITEHVSLQGKSLSENMARASGGCKKYAPTKLGGGGGAQTEIFQSCNKKIWIYSEVHFIERITLTPAHLQFLNK